MAEQFDLTGPAARARIAANGLALGRSVDTWSLVLTTTALACALILAQQSVLAPLAFLLVSVVVGGVQKTFAMRVAFDEMLFSSWADRWSVITDLGDSTTVDTAQWVDFQTLDHALSSMGLLREQPGSLRDLDSRIRGARKLLVRQLSALALQLLTWILGILELQYRFSG